MLHALLTRVIHCQLDRPDWVTSLTKHHPIQPEIGSVSRVCPLHHRQLAFLRKLLVRAIAERCTMRDSLSREGASSMTSACHRTPLRHWLDWSGLESRQLRRSTGY